MTGFKWLAKPVVAGVIFNAFVMVSHVPAVVNHAVASGNGFLHYGLHTVLVLSALLMWTPGRAGRSPSCAWARAAR